MEQSENIEDMGATHDTKSKSDAAHIKINNHMPGANNPLTDQAGQCITNTSVSPKPVTAHSVDDDDDDDKLVVFLGIEQALVKLDRVASKNEWLGCKIGLHQYGNNYVDCGERADAVFLENKVCMPQGLILRFRSHCAHIAHWARKEKGRQLPVKVKGEGSDGTNPIAL